MLRHSKTPASNLPKILFLGQLPPPVHGSAVVSKSIFDSDLINQSFCTKHIDISSSNDLSKIGKLSATKVLSSLKSIMDTIVAIFRFKPQICHFCFHPFGFAFVVNLALLGLLRAFGINTVLHLHCKGIDEKSRHGFLRYFYKLVFTNSSVILLDISLLADIKHLGHFKKPIYFVANGVPVVPKQTKPEKRQRIRFLFLSNLMPQKGAHDVVAAFAELNKRTNKKISLSIAGATMDSDYQQSLLAMPAQLGVEHCIDFIGPVAGDQKQKLLNESDVLVFPTYNDCFPLVILEAMSHSLPVISTTVGAIPNIVSKEHGCVVEPGDIESIVLAMESYCEKPNLLNTHARNARRRQNEEFSLATFEENLCQVLLSELRAQA